MNLTNELTKMVNIGALNNQQRLLVTKQLNINGVGKVLHLSRLHLTQTY